ncbi:MAG: hypothetical protein ACK5Q5_19730 [Planctomycetaceae bacterium]
MPERRPQPIPRRPRRPQWQGMQLSQVVGAAQVIGAAQVLGAAQPAGAAQVGAAQLELQQVIGSQ